MKQALWGITAFCLMLCAGLAVSWTLPRSQPSRPVLSGVVPFCDKPLAAAFSLRDLLKRDPKWSECSGWNWLDGYSAQHDGALVFVDIGCSLGYSLANVFGVKANGFGFSASTLHGVLQTSDISNCGSCQDCKHAGMDAPATNSKIVAYCLESSPRNYKTLLKVKNHFFAGGRMYGSANDHGMHVFNYYVTNTSLASSAQSIGFPALCIGAECSVSSAATWEEKADIATITADAFASSANLGFIDILNIDVGGDEPAVIDGAIGLLRSKMVGVVVLQHSQQGMWLQKGTGLKPVLDMLQQNSYMCHWAGKEGFIPVTNCYTEIYSGLTGKIVCSPYEHFSVFPSQK